MAIGIFVCSGSLLVGALAGASLNRFIPEHFKKTLPLIAGLISISMGTVSYTHLDVYKRQV